MRMRMRMMITMTMTMKTVTTTTTTMVMMATAMIDDSGYVDGDSGDNDGGWCWRNTLGSVPMPSSSVDLR